jgi:hypothetical protein
MMLSRDDATEAASKIFANAKAPAALRRDALQVLLLAQPAAEAQRKAAEVLKSGDPPLRKLALLFLTAGPARLHSLRWEELHLSSVEVEEYLRPPGQPIVPLAPAGVNAELLKPLLQDADSEVAAGAAYLLALLHEPGGLDVLVRYWRQHKRSDETWTRLVYRAASATNDDAQVPLLDEIYRGFAEDDSNVSEFYWTIRVMEGPQALKLRKRIRDEVGMERLR